MMNKEIDISELIPHEGKMSLLDNLVSFDVEKKEAIVSLTVSEDNLFYEKSIDGIPNWIAIEYMAQASAALAGLQDKLNSFDGKCTAKPGFLLGTRKLDLSFEKFDRGVTYTVKAVNTFNEDGLASFDCEVRNGAGEVIAEAVLTAYRPQDMDEFLKREEVV